MSDVYSCSFAGNVFFVSHDVAMIYIMLSLWYTYSNHLKGGVRSLLKWLNSKCINCIRNNDFYYHFFKRFIIIKIVHHRVFTIIELMAKNGEHSHRPKEVSIKLGWIFMKLLRQRHYYFADLASLSLKKITAYTNNQGVTLSQIFFNPVLWNH